MDKLSEENAVARAMGLSYGKYKAQQWLNNQNSPPQAKHHQKPPQKPQKRTRKCKDPEAFKLWQEGKTDAEIAKHFGVSRTIIQRWRDILELPSTTKEKVDTKKYRLEKTPDGEYYTIKIDTIK